MKKESVFRQMKRFVREHKLLFSVVLISIFVVFAFAATEIYLYIRFLLGNDVIVSLDSSERDIFVENGKKFNVSFNVHGIANPLCSMECSSLFFDASKNKNISEEIFFVKPNTNKEIFYELSAEGNGIGQELYQFSVSCHNKKSFFCHTEEEPMTRNILLTINRELNFDEKYFQAETERTLFDSVPVLFYLRDEILYTERDFIKLNAFFDMDVLSSNIDVVTQEIDMAFNDLKNVEEFWKGQEFETALEKTIILKDKILKLERDARELNETLSNRTSRYNDAVEEFSILYEKIENLSKQEYNASDLVLFEQSVELFNRIVFNFNASRNLAEKEQIASAVRVMNLSKFENLNYRDEALFFSNVSAVFYLEKILSESRNYSDFSYTLPNIENDCCLFGECSQCCRACSDENYPVLFVHGHDFTEGISAEYSIVVFDKIQNKLAEEGYLKAGEIYYSYRRSDVEGILGRSNTKLTYRGSYYFDSFIGEEGYLPVQTKSENIDTYSIRLNDLIEEVKYETGKDKVILVSYSMGGLVSRRYLQIFGNESIEKMILIATPNLGIKGSTARYCSFFGASRECDDMKEDSLFMNKLNNRESDRVETINIIGAGCDTDGENGDGVVAEDNARLEGTHTFVVDGDCTGVNLLHEEIVDIDKYPEVYKIIRNELR